MLYKVSDILAMLAGCAGYDGSICWRGWIFMHGMQAGSLYGYVFRLAMLLTEAGYGGWLCCLRSLVEYGVYAGSMAVLAKVAAWLC
jgi:hypothetical protein